MENAPSTIAIVAEKPSVARDIARVVGATKQGDGFLHGNNHVVTWAIGHLVSLAQPHEIRPEWKSWRRDLLPMLPQDWPLVVYDRTKPQFEIVRKILSSDKIARIICATDAGREGELIFRYIYEASDCHKPVQRLWISSLTPEAIRNGLNALKPGADYDPLADAARGRSRADWLVGMNLSRAYSIAFNDKLSVGRVQTPTLAMLVERELEIRAFVPTDYIEVIATFSPDKGKSKYKGTYFRGDKTAESRLDPNAVEANQIVARAKSGNASIESLQAETQRALPLLLYDLTELQRHANRLFGFSAQKTLDLAQALYEKHKLISYPRTDSRHLSNDVANTLPKIVDAIRGDYEVAVKAVIDWLEQRGDVDAKRIGLWGVSLGGYYAPRAAAFEKRVKACIALSGAYDMGEAWDGLPELTRETFRTRAHCATQDEARRVAATLSLQGVAAKITCPLYLVAGKLDRVVPWRDAERLAREAGGPVDLVMIEDGNHVANNRIYKYRPQSADWMAKQLGLPKT